MMIGIALLFLAEALPTADISLAKPDDKDIIVMARKTRRWQGTYNNKNGNFTCQTDVGTGDPEIDAIGCISLKICGPRYESELMQLIEARQVAGKIPSRKDLRLRSMPAIKKIQKCMNQRWLPGLRELKQRRASVLPTPQ